ncbi:MAG: hypothetical protein ABI321_19530 [Polyangia bacterium]
MRKHILACLVTLCVARGVHADPVRSLGLSTEVGAKTSVAIYLNGTLIASAPAGNAGTKSIALQGMVIPGENRLEIRVGSGTILPDAKKPTLLATPSPDDFIVATLEQDVSTKNGEQYDTKTEPLQKQEWRPSRQPPTLRYTMPYVLSFRFTLPATASAPVWLHSEKVSATTDKAAAIALAQQIMGHLAGGRIPAIGELMHVGLAETARAFPLQGTAEEGRKQLETELATMRHAQQFAIKPLDPTTVVCATERDDHVLVCHRPDGGSLVQVTSPEFGVLPLPPEAFIKQGGKLEPL